MYSTIFPVYHFTCITYLVESDSLIRFVICNVMLLCGCVVTHVFNFVNKCVFTFAAQCNFSRLLAFQLCLGKIIIG